MTQPLSRDELARDLYLRSFDPLRSPLWKKFGAADWDSGRVSAESRADFYARADQLLTEETDR